MFSLFSSVPPRFVLRCVALHCLVLHCCPRGAAADPSRLLLQENFDSGKFSKLWSEVIVKESYYPSGSGPVATLPGHGKALYYHVPVGFNEISPATVSASGSATFTKIAGRPSVDEFYMEWEEMFPDGTTFAQGAQKLLRFTHYKEGDPPGCELNLIAGNGNRNIQLSFIHPGDTNGSPIDLFKNTNLPMPTGRWVKIVVWTRLNTPGQNDGFGRVWLDGEQIVAMENLSNRGHDARGWNTMWIGGTFSNGAGKLSRSTFDRYIDNIRWFSTKPPG